MTDTSDPSPSTRHSLEVALANLSTLLEIDESRESEFQKFFEESPVIFEMMGYTGVHPKIRLPLSLEEQQLYGVDYLEPDFVLRRTNGLYDILDLKTPQEKLLRAIPWRATFYAKINEYVSQVVHYSEYFDERTKRQWVKENTGLDVQRAPDPVLIVGRDQAVDKQSVHEELRKRTSRLSIHTYDDIVALLRFSYTRLYGRTDSLPGFAVYAVISVHKPIDGCRRYVFDFGRTLDKDRISCFLVGDELHWEVVDSNSIVRPLSARIPADLLSSEAPFLVAFCMGNGDRFAFLQVRINNNVLAETLLEDGLSISPDLSSELFTLGQDLSGHNATGTEFGLFEVAAWPLVHSFDVRIDLVRHLMSKDYSSFVQFLPGTCLYAERGGMPAGNAVRLHNTDLRPRFRDYRPRET